MENIRTIAQKAGVSKSTVSRVINNEGYVSDEIRSRVQQVIDKTGYIPNGNAVKLSKGKNNLLGVTLPYNNSCYDQLANSILHQSKVNGYQVLILPTYFEEALEETYFSLLKTRVIDGLIVTNYSTSLEKLEKLSLIGKLVVTEKVGDSNLPNVYPNRKKIYDQLFYDISQDNPQQLFFTTKRSVAKSQSTRDKVESFSKYFGNAIEKEHYYVGISGYSEGYHWAISYFKNRQIPQVFFANGDDTAAGIIAGLKKLGIEHKKDYQMIGEGNTAYSEILDFSTIDFFAEEIGKEAVNFLLSRESYISVKKMPQLIQR